MKLLRKRKAGACRSQIRYYLYEVPWASSVLSRQLLGKAEGEEHTCYVWLKFAGVDACVGLVCTSICLNLQVRNLHIKSTNGHNLPLRIFAPQSGGPFPVLVWYHGGGFVMGGLNSHTCAPCQLRRLPLFWCISHSGMLCGTMLCTTVGGPSLLTIFLHITS